MMKFFFFDKYETTLKCMVALHKLISSANLLYLQYAWVNYQKNMISKNDLPCKISSKLPLTKYLNMEIRLFFCTQMPINETTCWWSSVVTISTSWRKSLDESVDSCNNFIATSFPLPSLPLYTRPVPPLPIKFSVENWNLL